MHKSSDQKGNGFVRFWQNARNVRIPCPVPIPQRPYAPWFHFKSSYEVSGPVMLPSDHACPLCHLPSFCPIHPFTYLFSAEPPIFPPRFSISDKDPSGQVTSHEGGENIDPSQKAQNDTQGLGLYSLTRGGYR